MTDPSYKGKLLDIFSGNTGGSPVHQSGGAPCSKCNNQGKFWCDDGLCADECDDDDEDCGRCTLLLHFYTHTTLYIVRTSQL